MVGIAVLSAWMVVSVASIVTEVRVRDGASATTSTSVGLLHGSNDESSRLER